MKIALLSDIHANYIALNAVVKDAMERNIDHIIFAGDAVGYYPFINEACSTLREIADWCIMGNHDAFLAGRLSVSEDKRTAYALDYSLREISVENMDWLKNLPEFLELGLSGKLFRVYHGSPWNYLEGYIYPDYDSFSRFDNIEADFVILGHTHYPMIKHVGEKIIINPGSCGQPRDYDPRASYALLDTESGEVNIRRISYDTETVMKKAVELGFDRTVCKMLVRTKR